MTDLCLPCDPAFSAVRGSRGSPAPCFADTTPRASRHFPAHCCRLGRRPGSVTAPARKTGGVLVRAGDLNCFGKRSRARSRPSHVSGSVTKGVGTDGAKTPRNSNCSKLTFCGDQSRPCLGPWGQKELVWRRQTACCGAGGCPECEFSSREVCLYTRIPSTLRADTPNKSLGSAGRQAEVLRSIA